MTRKKKSKKDVESKDSTSKQLVRRDPALLSNSLDLYLHEINKIPLLTKDEEYALAVQYLKTGDPRIAHKLVTANLRFVVKVAMQYTKYGVKLRDLIQEGNMGLMVAVKKYNPNLGYRLLSYAVWWIKAYIQKYILDTWSLVRIGRTQAQRKLFNSMKKAQQKIRAMGGEEPSDATLAELLDVREKDVADMRQRLAGHDLSLNATIDSTEQGGLTHLDALPSEQEDVDELIIREDQIQLVQEAIAELKKKLSKRDLYILENRLLADSDPITLREIGEKYKISRERARQLEANIKKKLKKLLVEHQQ